MNMLRLDVSDHVAVVTIDNPPVNAQPPEFMTEIMEKFDSFSDRDDVRAVILTGTGKMFSAGAELKKRPGPDAPPGTMWGRMRLAREAMYSIMECKKPVIAAINGPAIGAGFGLAAVCDILVASDNSYLSLPEIDVGLMGGARHAMRLFPHSLVSLMVLTGYRVPAEELYRLGITVACPTLEGLMPYCMDLAHNIAAKSPIAIGLAKDALVTVGNLSIRDGYRYEQSNTVRLSKTEDAVEARTAVLEKRAPVFKGR
ncbi:enoyl-CoA hydratase [Sphingomonas sp. Leaf357]|uniref:enoyl-CoA hydratase/isomerase family protein n=1 Tax=Sphingomonas sp. Leaf357 TaxID=1736350 RepID=UPI0006FE9D70|nr:enoyl-CoA hydratase/isomerase family protein [Sphingomonas sp. Leaf357]KQS03604.1 enoyl-CoA hydratase [Sphingomonas sp. Leaf357]